MTSGLVIAVLAGLGGMLGWGFADFFAKKTIDRLGDVETLFWGQLLGIMPLAILFAVHPAMPSFGAVDWLCMALLGAWSGLSYIPTYVAFGKGQVSVLSPIFASYAVVVAILSALFFHEVIPGGRIVAFVVVFAGVALISGDPRDVWKAFSSRKSDGVGIRGLREILLAVGLYSLWLIAFDQFVNGRDWIPILLVVRSISAVSLFAYASASGRKLRVQDSSLWKYLIAVGLFDVLAFASISFGYSATPYVSVVTMLSAAFSLPTIILARVFLGERATGLQMAGSALVLAGVMLLPFV